MPAIFDLPASSMETLCRQIIEGTQDGVWLIDAQGKTLFANRQMAAMLACAPEEMSRSSMYDFMSEGARSLAESNLARRKDGVSELHEFSFTRKDGSEIWTMISTNPVYDANGQFCGALAVVTDLSSRKKSDAEAELSRRILEKTSRIARVGGWQLDLVRNKLFWSQVTKEIHGVPPDYEPELSTAINFYKEGESRTRITAAVEEGMKFGKPWNLELQLITAQGHEIQVVANGEVVFENQVPVQIFGTFQDITERKRFESELIAAKESAERAALIKARFLDTAAHELRTPVTSFSLLLELAENELRAGRPVPLELLAKARKQSERLSRLVTELLEVSRLEHGQVRLQIEKVDLGALLEECIEDFTRQFPSRQFSFDRPLMSVEVECDPLRIRQVLSNLLDNAVKYAPQSLPIAVSIETRPGTVRVAVADQGASLPKEERISLFSPFSRGTTDEVEKTSGLGLGLFISSGIIGLHGGSIDVITTSEKGGNSFYFDLPLKRGSR